jgi:hypothetical protein
MSDFDKPTTPPGSAEKKKLAVAGTLAAMLLTLGAFHFLKAAPQAASASVIVPIGNLPSTLIAPDETPAQAQAALQKDPTARLLRGSQENDHTFDALPRNPFRMAPDWESLLVKPEEVASPTATHTEYAVPTTVSPRAVDTTSLKLTGIFHQGQHLYAIINGSFYTAGMTIDTAKILDITPTEVTLQRADSAVGPKATLTLEPKLK